MTEVTGRIERSDNGYRAEVSQPGKSIHIAEALASEADAQRWIEAYRRLVDADERRQC
jgi:hypothetical protein